MTATVNSAVGIPGNDVAETLLNIYVAVWADPRLAVFGVGPGGRLHVVFDAVFDFGALDAAKRAVEV